MGLQLRSQHSPGRGEFRRNGSSSGKYPWPLAVHAKSGPTSKKNISVKCEEAAAF